MNKLKIPGISDAALLINSWISSIYYMTKCFVCLTAHQRLDWAK